MKPKIALYFGENGIFLTIDEICPYGVVYKPTADEISELLLKIHTSILETYPWDIKHEIEINKKLREDWLDNNE